MVLILGCPGRKEEPQGTLADRWELEFLALFFQDLHPVSMLG